MAICKGCGAEIIFIRTYNGKRMPCDPEQVTYWKGNTDKIVTPNGEVISCSLEGNINDAIGIGYISHFATCSKAGKFRRKP